MKLQEYIDNKVYFESSCEKTTQFKQFALQFKKEVKAMFKGFNVKFNVGHFYISGFINDDQQHYVYFSISDVRPCFHDQILIRTAKSDKDYTGGSNKFTTLSHFASDVNVLFLKMESDG